MGKEGHSYDGVDEHNEKKYASHIEQRWQGDYKWEHEPLNAFSFLEEAEKSANSEYANNT